ncbi:MULTISPECIES: pyrimidine utilization protein D [unclassified Sphingomonas]|uniref:pyrimidine utilization protein D n=1 Tax=unclassified Sphingomonas TaxID=196159 RepID=UPI000BC970DC|nr:MAG: pyrimidine utilization protein D [Sphingomonas sp. 12-62-6]OYX37047.1 MAG: pyrimidine utilization protein D [Sphingomonas sp. 32-62-10]
MAHAAGLWYEWHGSVDAPVVIMSPGLGGSAGYWTPNLAALTARYRVLLYDHRGTARSDKALPETVTVETMAADLLALMDALGIAKAHLIGHAAGGIIGLAMALKAPARLDKLIVVNGWVAPDPHFARCFDVRLALLRHIGPAAYVRAQPIFLFPADWISANSAALDAEEPLHLSHFPPPENIERRVAALKAFDIGDRLGEIDVPVLAIVAADDMLVPASCADAIERGIAGARRVTMAWGGHACNITDPDRFNAIALEFLGD